MFVQKVKVLISDSFIKREQILDLTPLFLIIIFVFDLENFS